MVLKSKLHERSRKVTMQTKLSKLQKFILMRTYSYGKILNADVLIHWYGFQPVSHGGIKFSRKQIGMKRYLSAATSPAKALTRLRGRGLMRRGYLNRGHMLTPAGKESAQRILNG